MSIVDCIIEQKSKILVIGDIMLDRFIFGEVNRISPEAPVPVVRFSKEKYELGGCGNVVRNLVGLGAKPTTISIVGDDLNGDKILNEFNQMGLSSAKIIKSKKSGTTVKMRIVGDRQQIVRVDYDENHEKDISNASKDNLINIDMSKMDGVIISDYNKGVCNQKFLKKIFESAKLFNIPIFVDPKGNEWRKYYGANIITPNRREAEIIIGSDLISKKDYEQAGIEICKRFNISSCLITKGSEGMSYISDQNIFHLASKAKEIFDVSGAGDTVISCVALAIVAGIAPKKAVDFSNKAAGIVVGHLGTSAITIDELKRNEN